MNPVVSKTVAGMHSGAIETRRRRLTTQSGGDRSFSAVLQAVETQCFSTRFSKHAVKRVETRGIPITQTDLSRLDGAIARVREKGSRTALVLMDGRAFVVGPQSGTVVTALGREDLQNHVFTNIDATVVV